MPRVLILLAHPQRAHSRVNEALAGAAQAAGFSVRDLYALYPDYLIDVRTEQAALAEASLVVWLHPVHWYGMPPLMKLWLDEVFSFGWAYRPGGRAGGRCTPRTCGWSRPPAGPNRRTGRAATTGTFSTPSSRRTSRQPR